ncbi:hypothetical protein COV17_04055 [Candidatus Woesearchaeota archaeon CG10_big_fil_rev_8_21_14_0_10_36_11]|nr:MAG: hypothetical protein COV17_04055 [Candidatus Woesearchaeota archaeon CG10_big_fil_rev_8_21_14_0_10_36_11]
MKKTLFDTLKPFLGFKPNRFWTNANHSELVGQEELHHAIQRTLDELDIREGEYGVHGVYLFGSVLKLHGKDSCWKEPSDVDVYFWQRNPHRGSNRNHTIEERLKIALQRKFHFYGLPLDITSFPMRPADNVRAGFIIQRNYPLYVNCNFIRDYSDNKK